MKQIAFFGVGNMGLPMALNLKKAGYSLKVYDVSPKAIASAKEQGLDVSESRKDILNGASVIVSMLPASRYVEDLYLGSGGLVELAQSGSLFIDCSTIAPESAKKVAQAVHARGFQMIDAPVSGGTAGAQAATLTFMVGGENSAVELARPLLEKMGKNIFHAGPIGSGQVVKICNNMLLAIHMIGSCEALALGRANGLDPKVLSNVLLQSSGKNWSLEVYNPWPGVQEKSPASRDYQGGFAVDLMAKDLSLAMESALATGASTPLGALARNLYRMHSQSGNGHLDFSSILNFLKEKNS